jgi:hypothetical protein
MTRRADWTALDREETERFRYLQRFVAECRRLWPNSRIIIRSNDGVSVELEARS